MMLPGLSNDDERSDHDANAMRNEDWDLVLSMLNERHDCGCNETAPRLRREDAWRCRCS